MSRYRIAMVAACPFPANHGSPASIREMSEALAQLGHQVHVVTYPDGQDIPVKGVVIHRAARILSSKEVSVGPSWKRPILDLMLSVKLCRVIRRERIEIIHAHNYEGALVGFLAKLITRKPFLYNAVNTMIDELPGYRFIRPKALAVLVARLLDRWVPRGADHITVVSKELGDFLKSKGISEHRITIVPAGVNLEMFEHPDPEPVRRRFGIGSHPVVMYTGTMDPFQRIDYLLRAMQKVVSALPETRLMIVSNIVVKEFLDRHRMLARDLGIEDRVIFTGPIPLPELPSYLAAADVVVMPRPACPGHPVKLLNYMAAGKAIVAFEGSAKGLRNLYNGIVVPDHDWGQFGAGILTLMKETELALRLGENARTGIVGTFDWVTLANGISVLYTGLVHVGRNGLLRLDQQELRKYLKASYDPVPPGNWVPARLPVLRSDKP
ncbi:MAG: glycosyltransferase family 4 protein [Nitrospirae bacterium]|nr:glycosyltransferase family 4 protein [Nitrospirota bacterium]